MNNTNITIDRMATAITNHEEYMDKIRAKFQQSRPTLEHLAAAGDADAAQALIDGDELLRAKLRLVPNPDKPGYLTLSWVTDDEEVSAA